MPDPAHTPTSLLHMSIGGAIAVCGVCFTFLGAFVGWIKVFHGPSANHNSELDQQDGYIRRREWDQACQGWNRQYDQITETLERLESKHDENSRWVQRVVQDLERRVGVIEARHRDLTGDPIGPGPKEAGASQKENGNVMGYRRVEDPPDAEPERRTGKHPDTGRRRRATNDG